MCGILCFSDKNRTFHHRLLDSLRKRGPDDIGFWSNGNVGMAHTRLAIIGLDIRSSEPMENKTHVLAYNGEIYNFLEVKDELNREGLHVAGANDAMVLLEAWRLWGEKCLSKLYGFWAFVIYEKETNRLILVRDQMGVKPLYYWHSKNFVYVSSMMSTILEVVDASPDLDYTAISEYVTYQFTFGNKTFFSQIKKVMPGEIVEVCLNDWEIH